MIVVITALIVLYGIELISIIQLKRGDKEAELDNIVYLEDAHRFKYIEEDCANVHVEVINLRDDLTYAI